MGTPSEKVWKNWEDRCLYNTEMWEYLKDYKMDDHFWRYLFSLHRDVDLEDLIWKCLEYSDKTRISAKDALTHKYFEDCSYL